MTTLVSTTCICYRPLRMIIVTWSLHCKFNGALDRRIHRVRRHLLFWRELTVHQSSIDGRASRSCTAIQAHQSQEDTNLLAPRALWRLEVLYRRSGRDRQNQLYGTQIIWNRYGICDTEMRTL